jgi:hypothetical protein
MSVMDRLPFALLIAASCLLSSYSTASAENGMDAYIDGVLRMGIMKPKAPIRVPSGDGGYTQTPGGGQTFGGYDCSDDCSGHKAGFEWAERNDITDEYDCASKSVSFNEGCAAYADDRYRDADYDDDRNYIP